MIEEIAGPSKKLTAGAYKVGLACTKNCSNGLPLCEFKSSPFKSIIEEVLGNNAYEGNKYTCNETN